jgi:hypothetical protein
MNCSIRKWNLIGPFPNPNDEGLEQMFPPERGIDFQAVCEGEGGREIGWIAADMDQPRVAPDLATGWDWAVVPNAGGRYAPESFVADYGRVLKLGRWPAGTVRAQTYVFVPEVQAAVIVLATPCPSTTWCNGRQVYSRWVRPSYHELKDGFAYRIPVRLDAGWNSLLLKFLHHPARPTRAAFTCRLETADGQHLKALAAALRQLRLTDYRPGRVSAGCGSQCRRSRARFAFQRSTVRGPRFSTANLSLRQRKSRSRRVADTSFSAPAPTNRSTGSSNS